jgi:acyl transferase domain-containing protein
MSGDTDLRPLLEQAFREIRGLRREVEESDRRRAEPIAVVGLGCRLPGGVAGPADYWRLLRDGVDAVGEIPPDRWDAAAWYDPDPDAQGKMYCTRGAFLEGVDQFDPGFFGIAPREAAGIDPQQRLLLEVAWEALEHAGIAPDRLAGTDAGIFAGLFLDDYSRLGFFSGDPARLEAYGCLGALRGMAAGRLAYVLGVHGPALQVDTACSSSLLAVHLACQSLRARECDLALAGGVTT